MHWAFTAPSVKAAQLATKYTEYPQLSYTKYVAISYSRCSMHDRRILVTA